MSEEDKKYIAKLNTENVAREQKTCNYGSPVDDYITAQEMIDSFESYLEYRPEGEINAKTS